jgi:ribosome-associated protein
LNTAGTGEKKEVRSKTEKVRRKNKKARRAGTIMIEFRLEDREYIELNDLLKVTGLFDSGGMAKTAIAEGRVLVDGRQELRRRCKIRKGQVVVYEGRAIVVT